jgi:hypothetical protein
MLTRGFILVLQCVALICLELISCMHLLNDNIMYAPAKQEITHILLNKYPIRIGYGCALDTVRVRIQYATWRIRLFYYV